MLTYQIILCIFLHILLAMQPLGLFIKACSIISNLITFVLPYGPAIHCIYCIGIFMKLMLTILGKLPSYFPNKVTKSSQLPEVVIYACCFIMLHNIAYQSGSYLNNSHYYLNDKIIHWLSSKFKIKSQSAKTEQCIIRTLQSNSFKNNGFW